MTLIKRLQRIIAEMPEAFREGTKRAILDREIHGEKPSLIRVKVGLQTSDEFVHLLLRPDRRKYNERVYQELFPIQFIPPIGMGRRSSDCLGYIVETYLCNTF